MSEFIDREKAIANIKAAYCCGCENYNGVRCRACQIMDAMDVLEEESQEVCKAFRAKGHEAYSCDIQEPSGGHPEWHILGDALKALEGGKS